MKVDSGAQGPEGAQRAGKSGAGFQKTLKSVMQDARPRATARLPLPALKTSGSGSAAAATGVATGTVRAQALQSARVGMNAEATRLFDVRAEAAAASEERMNSRLVDMLCKELVQEFVQGRSASRSTAHQEPAPASVPGPRMGPSPAQATSGSQAERSAGGFPMSAEVEAKVAATMELVDRIDAFVHANRPGLSLSLRGPIDAEVEVERTGRSQVALQVRGKHGPPNPQDLSRIREALAERGLRLSSLSVS